MIPTTYVQRSEDSLLASLHRAVADRVFPHLGDDQDTGAEGVTVETLDIEGFAEVADSIDQAAHRIERVEDALRTHQRSLADQASSLAEIDTHLGRLEEAHVNGRSRGEKLLGQIDALHQTVGELRAVFGDSDAEMSLLGGVAILGAKLDGIAEGIRTDAEERSEQTSSLHGELSEWRGAFASSVNQSRQALDDIRRSLTALREGLKAQPTNGDFAEARAELVSALDVP
jgi:septal ring factor EnvC (AmiA/AmiB activator)